MNDDGNEIANNIVNNISAFETGFDIPGLLHVVSMAREAKRNDILAEFDPSTRDAIFVVAAAGVKVDAVRSVPSVPNDSNDVIDNAILEFEVPAGQKLVLKTPDSGFVTCVVTRKK
jgi:hypothetical protein